MRLLVFRLDNQRYGLHLSLVDRVERAVEVTPIPEAPEVVLGIIDVHGKVLPVCNIRKRFQRPERELDVQDFLIIAATTRRRVALLVDAIEGVDEVAPEEITQTQEVLPDLPYIEGVVTTANGMILIHDLDRFLSLEEENELTRVMTGMSGNGPNGGA